MASVLTNLRTNPEQILSIENAVFFTALGSLAVAAMLVAKVSGNIALIRDTELPAFEDTSPIESQEHTANAELSSYQIITSRNIFGVKKDETSTTVSTPTVALSLRLVGTSVTEGATPFAIIEDTKKNEQDVFDLNQQVFGQAKLVEILPDSVKIEQGGKIQTLFIEENTSSGGGSSEEGITSNNEDGTNFSVPEDQLNEELANLPRLLSQARAVPYFRNGQSIGMRLFAIRSGSLYEKLGLKNGDILLAVNGQSLSDPTQALKLFETLRSEKRIAVKVERSGQEKALEYSID